MTKTLKTQKTKETIPPDVAELLYMLMYKRPSSSVTEDKFISRFVLPLGAEPDDYGNHWLVIGDAPILWSCHTDTVHDTEGTQKLLYGAGMVSVDKGECLGADCGTGVWLMSQMIKAEVPGVYVFHADEEIGGYGSQHIADKHPEWLEGIKYAIAFDRKGVDEIITHQLAERCASQAFADSLAECLAPLKYRVSSGGTFTDTANYRRLIPECTNISVGYYKQHTKGEHQDVAHAIRLRDVLITADFTKLVCERDHTAPVLQWKRPDTRKWYESEIDRWEDARDPDGYMSEDDLTAYVRRNASEVADFIRALGYDRDDIDNFTYYQDVGEKDC